MSDIRKRYWKDPKNPDLPKSKRRWSWEVKLDSGKKGKDGRIIWLKRNVPGGEGVTKPEAKKFLDDLRDEMKAKKEQTKLAPTVTEYWADFLRLSAVNNSPAEMVNKANCAKYFLKAYGTKRLTEIDGEALEQFDATLAEEALSPKTRKNFRGIVKRMLKLAVRAKHIIGVPVTEPIYCRKAKGRALTDAECKALHDACDNPDVQFILFLGWKVGLRIGEILGLKWSDVDWDNGTLRLRLMDGAIRRSRVKDVRDAPGPLKEYRFLDGDQIIPLFAEVLVGLKAWQARCRKGAYVVTNPEGKHYVYFEIRRNLDRAYVAAGLPVLGWHTLRRSFITIRATEQGVPVPIVSRLVTHKSTTMTDRYLNVSDKQLLDYVRGRV